MEEEVICENCGMKSSSFNAITAFSKKTIYVCGRCEEKITGNTPDTALNLKRINDWAERKAQEKEKDGDKEKS